MFAINSRYYRTQTARLALADGTEVAYLRRRLIPQPERFAQVGEHVITEGDRLDLVANEHIGDPEQFWRVADANVALRPEGLTEAVGRRLRLTLPEGIPGANNA